MLKKVLYFCWHHRTLSYSFSLILFVGGVIAALFALGWAQDVRAQDEGPVCPPGFEWQRMSGVGCVQVDCAEAGGRYSYTSACICDDGLKACTEEVDYSNFDQESCGIFCPGSRVVACVAADDLCPGEEPPEVVIPTEPPLEIAPPPIEREPEPAGLGPVEHFIIGGEYEPPDPLRAAAAAAASTLMLSGWALLQRLGQRNLPAAGKRRVETGGGGLAGGSGSGAQASGVVREKGGELFTGGMDVVDRWPGGGGDQAKAPVQAPATRPERSAPVSGLTLNPHSEVFYGEDALMILQEMEKLPWTLQKTDRARLGDVGLNGLAGTHPDGRPRRMTIPSGREIVVGRVLSVAYAGASAPAFIEFTEKLALTAELVDVAEDDFLDAPTIRKAPPDDPGDVFDAPTMLRGEGDDDGS